MRRQLKTSVRENVFESSNTFKQLKCYNFQLMVRINIINEKKQILFIKMTNCLSLEVNVISVRTANAVNLIKRLFFIFLLFTTSLLSLQCWVVLGSVGQCWLRHKTRAVIILDPNLSDISLYTTSDLNPYPLEIFIDINIVIIVIKLINKGLGLLSVFQLLLCSTTHPFLSYYSNKSILIKIFHLENMFITYSKHLINTIIQSFFQIMSELFLNLFDFIFFEFPFILHI